MIFHFNLRLGADKGTGTPQLLYRLIPFNGPSMGLLKTFLSSTSVPGIAKTTLQDTVRRRIWMALCCCCYSGTLVCIAYVIISAMDPENVVTAFGSHIVTAKGETCIEVTSSRLMFVYAATFEIRRSTSTLL